MKLQLYSDVHLEFAENATFRPLNVGSDVLILSGDICVANYFTRSEDSPYYDTAQSFLAFFEWCSDNWKDIIYVAGNHEHYRGLYNDTENNIRDALKQFENIHYLDYGTVRIGDFLFVGTTLWTDNNKGCPITEATVGSGMSDYQVVTYVDGATYRKLRPFDTARFHTQAKVFIQEAIRNEENVVVVGHHAPSPQSVDEDFKTDHYFNGAYYSVLDYFIMEHPQIKLWTHGHMHQAKDYMIEGTRVVCNPRGYPGQYTGFDAKKVIEI